MKYRQFALNTVNKMNVKCFTEVKSMLVGKYVDFSIIKEENITREILAEKLCDYIEKLELKTGKSFNKHLSTYFDDMNSIVKGHLEDDSRADRYYQEAQSYVTDKIDKQYKLDNYTRIILCLYAKIIKSPDTDISNFDLSLNSIKLKRILSSMDKEKKLELNLRITSYSQKRFNTKDRYCSDSFTYLMVIIMYYRFKNMELKGEE